MHPPLLSISMRYFVEVAQTGSVTRAAARLCVAASAVSRQIARLEDGLGTQLFERRSQGMVPTPAGLRLAGHLRHAVLDADQVIEQVRALGTQACDRVRVCSTEGFVHGFMQALMRDFQAAFPAAGMELHVGPPDEVSQRLLRGQSDIGLKYVVAPEPGLRVEHSAQAPVLAVMQPVHPLARMRSVPLARAVHHPLLVGGPEVTTRQLLDLACHAQGLRYQPQVVSNFSSVMLSLLCERSIALSGRLTVAPLIEAATVVARPFAEPLLQRRSLQVLARQGRTLSPLMQDFVQRLVAAMDSLDTTARGRRGRSRGSR